jgi:hypothetical protein
MNLYSNSPEHRLVLLAPRQSTGVAWFGKPVADWTRHQQLLREMQRFRGSIYLSDGAIRRSDLTVDGRHFQAADEESWHVLAIDRNKKVKGCSRYRKYPKTVRFDHMGVSRSEIARSDVWANRLSRAVQNEISIAHQRGIGVVEVGGWAVAEASRFGTDALRLALSTFALAKMLGGCIGLTTATVRHCSSTILRKLGGRLLNIEGQEIPRYFDTAYDCEMEILRFDSAELNPRFGEILDRLCADLASCEVVFAGEPAGMSDDWMPARERPSSSMRPVPQLTPQFA